MYKGFDMCRGTPCAVLNLAYTDVLGMNSIKLYTLAQGTAKNRLVLSSVSVFLTLPGGPYRLRPKALSLKPVDVLN